jgi:cold shock CspA family protein
MYRVKWYDPHKKYGYLECAGYPDILVGASVVRGRDMPHGAEVEATAMLGPKGLFATALMRIGAYESFDEKVPIMTGKLKWYNPSRGFGFICLKHDTNGDLCEPYNAFLHASVLRTCGVTLTTDDNGTVFAVRVGIDDETSRMRVTAIRHVTVLTKDALSE